MACIVKSILIVLFVVCAADDKGLATAFAEEKMQAPSSDAKSTMDEPGYNLELKTEALLLTHDLEESITQEPSCECEVSVHFRVENLVYDAIMNSSIIFLQWEFEKKVRTTIIDECTVDSTTQACGYTRYHIGVTWSGSGNGIDGIATLPCCSEVNMTDIQNDLKTTKKTFKNVLSEKLDELLVGFPQAGLEHVPGQGFSVSTFFVKNSCDDPSAIGDPHIGNMNGQKFNINQPGTHMFVRIPKDRGQPALLEMRALVQSAGFPNPCAMYIMEASFAGSWMGNASGLRIRASQKHPDIQITATDNWVPCAESLEPHKAGDWVPCAETIGDWVPCAEFPKIPLVLSESLEGMHGKALVSADAPDDGFTLRFGTAAIKIKHSSPEEDDFLNVFVKRLTTIPLKIGGLLGMGERDPEVEKLTDICEAAKEGGQLGLAQSTASIKIGTHSAATGATHDDDSASTAFAT